MNAGREDSHIAAVTSSCASRFLLRGAFLLAASLALVTALCHGTAMAAEGAKLSVGSLAPQASTAIDELEPNDSFEEATLISMNRSVYGASSDGRYYGDDDYFKVVLPASGSVKLTFANDRHAQGGGRFYTTIYNQYYESVTHKEWSSAFYTKPESVSVNLSKGVNYLRINADTWAADQPYHFKLSYNIPSTTVKATPSKNAATVKWTKKSGAAKYQLRYSTKKDMSGAKTADVPKGKGSKKITGLKSGKKYYVQVRVVKSVGGDTYYSPWSAKKSVKTK